MVAVKSAAPAAVLPKLNRAMGPANRPKVLARTPVALRAALPPGPQLMGPLGCRACPGSCAGAAELTVTGYGATTVCSSCLSVVVESVARSSGALAAQLLIVTRESAADGCGRAG